MKRPADRFAQHRAPLTAILNLTGFALICPLAASASEPAIEAARISTPPNASLLIGAAFALLATIGFSLRETGLSQARNTVNVMMKTLLVICIVVATSLLFGFGLTYHDWSLLKPSSSPETTPWASWLFHTTCVCLAVTVISGATGERTRFPTFLLVIFLFAGLAHPLLAHFTWASRVNEIPGWLENIGFLDTSGAVIIHAVAAGFALAGILVLGARSGRYGRDGSPLILASHSLPLASLGAFLAWLGLLGVTVGFELKSSALGLAIANLLIAAVFSSLAATAIAWKLRGRAEITLSLSAALAGAIAAGAGGAAFWPVSVVVLGLLCGLCVVFTTDLLERYQIDDASHVIPIHGAGGILGGLAAAFSRESSWGQLGIQAAGTLGLCLTSFLIGFCIFKAIELSLGLRVSDDDQALGLDFAEHSASAYPEFEFQDS